MEEKHQLLKIIELFGFTQDKFLEKPRNSIDSSLLSQNNRFRINNVGFFAILMLGCTLFGCNRSNTQKHEQSYNIFGGISRNSNFSDYDSFNETMVMKEELKKRRRFNEVQDGVIVPVLPIFYNDTFLATAEGSVIRAVDQQIKWRQYLDNGAIAAGNLCADKDENLYVFANDGALYSFSGSGERRWKLPLVLSQKFLRISDLLAMPDGIIVGFSGEISKISFDGKVLWRYNSTLSPTKTFAADSDGNIVVSMTHEDFNATDSLIILSPTGNLLTSIGFENTRLIKSPILSQDKIYVGGFRQTKEARIPIIFCLSAKKKLIWEKELPIAPLGISSDNADNIYVCGFNAGIGEPMSFVLCFNAEGKELWRQSYECSISTPISVGKEQLTFTVSKGKKSAVYFIRKDGTFSSVLSLHDMPIMNLQSAVDPSGNLVFGATEELSIIRIGEPAVYKLLPF